MPTSRAGTAALAAALLLGVAAPASAASGITSPGAGQVVARDAVVPLRALVEESGPSELSLQAPGAQQAEVVAASVDAGELAYDFDTACASSVCTGREPAVNGTWTVRLSGAAEDERTFVLRIPAAAPDSVQAVRSEAGVLVRWRQGDEPDLRGWRVESGSGGLVRDGIGLAACDPERMCSVEVPEEAGSWAVRAYRATCPDCAELLLSAPSAVVTTEDGALPVTAAGSEPSAAAAPAPEPAAAAPVRRPAQRDAFLSAFGDGRPAAPAPPPPPAAARLPALPQGSYEQELGYGEREVVVAQPRPPLSRAQDAVTSALGSGDRVRLLVLSALMVGGALWLRRWARQVIAD